MWSNGNILLFTKGLWKLSLETKISFTQVNFKIAVNFQTEGASYVSSFLHRSRDMFIWLDGGKRGENLLDTGAPFYDAYETKDGRYMAVGAIEPQFYQNFIKGKIWLLRKV